MRVLHLIGASRPGGAETFALRLITGFQRAGIDQKVVARTEGWIAGELAQEGIDLILAPFGGWFDQWFPLMTHRRVAKVVQDFQPDIVMAWMNRGAVFLPRYAQAVNIARLGGFYDLKHYRSKAQWLVGNTQPICDHCVAHGWNPERVRMIANFTPAPPHGWRKEREATRKMWGWGPTDVGIVQMGRLHAVKGVDIALRALAQLPPHVKLALVGEGPLRAELEALVRELGLENRVVFAGWMKTVSVVAAAADIWIAPSRHEPFGNTVLDAWAHGVPLVASQVGGMRDLVEPMTNGLVVPADDVSALAAAIGRLLDDHDLGTRLARAGMKTWQERFSEEKIVQDYLSFFQDIIRQHQKAPTL